MVYFSHITSKLYLSLATCIDLMLPPEQLSTRHGHKRDCHENPDQTNATTGRKRRPANQNVSSNPIKAHTAKGEPPRTGTSRPTTAQPPRPAHAPPEPDRHHDPTTLPFPATEANRGRLEDHLRAALRCKLFQRLRAPDPPHDVGPHPSL